MNFCTFYKKNPGAPIKSLKPAELKRKAEKKKENSARGFSIKLTSSCRHSPPPVRHAAVELPLPHHAGSPLSPCVDMEAPPTTCLLPPAPSFSSSRGSPNPSRAPARPPATAPCRTVPWTPATPELTSTALGSASPCYVSAPTESTGEAAIRPRPPILPRRRPSCRSPPRRRSTSSGLAEHGHALLVSYSPAWNPPPFSSLALGRSSTNATFGRRGTWSPARFRRPFGQCRRSPDSPRPSLASGVGSSVQFHPKPTNW